jgi:hypothetical protein
MSQLRERLKSHGAWFRATPGHTRVIRKDDCQRLGRLLEEAAAALAAESVSIPSSWISGPQPESVLTTTDGPEVWVRAAEPPRKPDGWVAGADAGVIARGLSARVYGDRRLAGGDAAHAVFFGIPPAAPPQDSAPSDRMTGEQVVEVRRIVENEGWGVELPDWGRLAARLADVLAPPAVPVGEPDKVRPPTVQEIEAAARHYYGDKYPDFAAVAISEAEAWLRAWLKVRDTEFAPPAAPVRDGALDVSRLDDDALIDVAQRVEHECTQRRIPRAAPVRPRSASCALAPFTAADEDLRRCMNAQPWSLRDVLARLADAADHLLDAHGCDAHGYEGVIEARDSARTAVAQLAAAPVREVRRCPNCGTQGYEWARCSRCDDGEHQPADWPGFGTPPATPDGALREAADVSDETEVLRRERDLAVREAGRRDQKWMDGIEAELGQKINWAAPFEEDLLRYLPSFSTVIRELRAAAQDASSLREAAAEYRRAVRDVEAGHRSPAGRVNRAHEALLRAALRVPEEE